jgi:hypothetical protein
LRAFFEIGLDVLVTVLAHNEGLAVAGLVEVLAALEAFD